MTLGEYSDVAVPEKPYPGFWQAIGLFVVYAFLLQVAIAPVWILDKVRHTTNAHHPGPIAVAMLVAGALVLWLVCQRLHVSPREIMGPLPRRPDLLLPMAGCVLGQLMVEVPALLWIMRRFPSLLPKDDLGLSRSAWGAILLVAIVGPLVEEIVFRGIVVRGLAARYGALRGVLLGAAMFGAAHISPLKMPGTILMGLQFGWWFVSLRSIWPGVFGHALNNLAAVLPMLWLPHGGEDAVPAFTWAEPAAALIGAVMLAGSVLVLYRKFQRSNSTMSVANSSTLDRSASEI